MGHLLLDKELWIEILDQVSPHPLFVLYQQRYEWSGAYITHKSYFKKSVRPEAFHIIAKIPSKGQLEAAFYFRLEVATKKWHLILIGNQIEAHTKDIGGYLSSVDGQRSNPFTILVLLISRYTQRLEQEYSLLENLSSQQERLTGLGSLGLHSVPLDPKEFDIRRTHFIAGNLRAAAFGIDFQIELAAFIQDCHRKILYLTHMPLFAEEEREINEDLESIKHVVMRQKAHYRQMGLPRTQAQLDAITMLIGQGDAKSSIKLAESSTKIAASTAQETTAMMTIAVLGLLYLPSTFMSSFFSTVFFNLNPNTNDLTIAKDVWILVIAALLLTILTLVLWIWLNGRGMSDISRLSKKLRWYRKEPKVLD